ncbi:MAG: tyrosine-type recombinase/integrase [Desulfobacteraceae bacterium]|nr:tyrosine-type recombinase/integrase [Desulfobacteraceae bacterium]
MASLIKRGTLYYAQYMAGKKAKRISLNTSSLQLAKEKLRQLESSLYRGEDNPLPTRTTIAKVVTAYVESMLARKTTKSVQRDVYYLREAFGPICPELELKNIKISEKGKKCPTKHAPQYIEAPCFEQVTTADVANYITVQVRRKGWKPKTANRSREVLTRLYNWAMEQNGIRMPGDKNPAAKVERYKERASEISFLTLEEIEEQLKALEPWPELQTMVAVYIYTGLRREELCWLTIDDVDLNAGNNGMIRVCAKTVNDKFWEPKTKVNRAVPISSTLRKYLDRYSPADVDGKFFFSTVRGCQWDPDNLSRELRDANESVGLDWTCLEFRHTFGSQLAMKGESLYKISKIMGNSPEICRKHYAALLPESLISSVEFGESKAPVPEPPAPKPVAIVMPFERERPRLTLVVNNR